MEKIKHIKIDSEEIALCGLLNGWTNPNQEIREVKYGTNCLGCQIELRRLKNIKL